MKILETSPCLQKTDCWRAVISSLLASFIQCFSPIIRLLLPLWFLNVFPLCKHQRQNPRRLLLIVWDHRHKHQAFLSDDQSNHSGSFGVQLHDWPSATWLVVCIRDDLDSQSQHACVTWFNGCQDSAGRLKHRLIDVPLVLGELPIGREGAGDVGGVTVVLSAHVKQTVENHGISSPRSYSGPSRD